MRHPEDTYIDQYGYWGEHPDYSTEDWRYLINNNETRAGYWVWVSRQVEEASLDASKSTT